ncbi:hypothetical protein ACX9R5_13290 [Rathayibacter sp. CAU 1779]
MTDATTGVDAGAPVEPPANYPLADWDEEGGTWYVEPRCRTDYVLESARFTSEILFRDSTRTRALTQLVDLFGCETSNVIGVSPKPDLDNPVLAGIVQLALHAHRLNRARRQARYRAQRAAGNR